MMSEKRFKIRYGTISTNYPSGRIFDNKKQHSLYLDEVVDLLNEQQTTIEEYEDFCLNLCKFLIGKGLVDEYREKYGKEYKIITKWKGCGSDE